MLMRGRLVDVCWARAAAQETHDRRGGRHRVELLRRTLSSNDVVVTPTEPTHCAPLDSCHAPIDDPLEEILRSFASEFEMVRFRKRART
jgi:hypothetical protein